jgi:hypothetical protein
MRRYLKLLTAGAAGFDKHVLSVVEGLGLGGSFI